MQMDATTAATEDKEELVKLQASKETFCTQRGLPAKVDPIFLTNRFGPLKENNEATAAMQLLTRLADESDAVANIAPPPPRSRLDRACGFGRRWKQRV